MKSLSGLIPERLFIKIFDYNFILIGSFFYYLKNALGIDKNRVLAPNTNPNFLFIIPRMAYPRDGGL